MEGKFLREIPKSKITQSQIDGLMRDNFKIVDKEDSVEVWVEAAEA